MAFRSSFEVLAPATDSLVLPELSVVVDGGGFQSAMLHTSVGEPFGRTKLTHVVDAFSGELCKVSVNVVSLDCLLCLVVRLPLPAFILTRLKRT